MTRDRFPTFDLDQNHVTPDEEAAAARWCTHHRDDGLVYRMLGLDHAPLRRQAHRDRPRPGRERYEVNADRSLLPDGWHRDPVLKARVHALVADLTAQGLTVNETARRVGLSSRGVQRLREHDATGSRKHDDQ